MNNAFKSFLLAFTTLIAGVSAFAQVTTSTLQGRVVDQAGEPVIGAAILAQHQPSGTVYGAVTNADGRYTIQGMRTGGPYSVEFSNLGYQGVNYSDITLQLGQAYTLNATMNETSELLDAVVFVATPSSKFAAQERMGATTNVSQQEIMSLPTANRSVSDIAKLSPYGGNGMSIAGGDGRSTNFTIDGANFNNNFGLSSSLPGGGNPVSMDAIEELQVVVSPFDVRQTNFIGGGINAITKSGTNTVKGTAYVYHQNGKLRGSTLNGVDIPNKEANRAEKSTVYGATVGFPIIKNKLFFFGSIEYQGEPANQVFAYRAYDGTSSYTYTDADGVEHTVTPAEILEKGYKNGGISRVLDSDMQRVSDHLKNRYGYDTGGWDDYAKDSHTIKLLGRIDWNIDQKNHLAVRYNWTSSKHWLGTNGSSGDWGSTKDGTQDKLTGTRLSLNRMSEYSMAFYNSMYSMENNVKTISFDLNSRLTNFLSNQLLITYSNIEDVRGSDSDKFPFIDIMKGYDATTGVQTLEPYISAGYELFTWYNGVHNRVLTLKDDITLYIGAHKITAGASMEYQFADNAYMREGTGYYRFRSVDDFINGAAPETVALTYGYTNNGMGDTPSARIRFNQIGFYGQDEWDVDEKLKLTLGVRYDTIVYNDNDVMTNNAIKGIHFGEAPNGGVHKEDDGCLRIDTGFWPRKNVQMSPRIGFTYDVYGDKTLKIRGGTGLFAGRLPLVFMTNMPTNAAMFQHLSVITTQWKNGKVEFRNQGLDNFAVGPDGTLPTTTEDILAMFNQIDSDKNPYTISSDKGQLSSKIAGVDPDFKMPQIWKSSLAVDMQLPTDFPFSLTAEYTFNKNVNANLIKDVNVKSNAGWSQWAGPDNRHMYPASAYYTGTPAYYLTNTNKGYGWIFVLAANAQPLKNFRLTASYTHTEQYEVTGMPGSDPESVFKGLPTVDGPAFATLQPSQYVSPDRLMASASYRLPWGTNISLLYNAFVPNNQSDAYGTFKFDSDVNGDANITDLIYVPKTKDEILFIDDTNRDIFWAFVEQDPYLRSRKGKYAQAYGGHRPMVHYFDVKVAQDIKVRMGKNTNTLQLSCDIMNVGNLINDSWGVMTTWSDTANNGQILSLDHINENGQPVFSTPLKEGAKSWMPSKSIGQAWYLQLGLKYMFN
ncbi:MAG: TonB-dependent receptor [Bacteroidales bacterium]|nr:TonB-dependent receptor [Bacteroidales bacterium]